MFIDGDITEETGSYFTRDVLWLESDGCKSVKLRINSGGGSVIGAYSVFSAIRQSKMVFTTVNEGIAASAAGWIWLAGDNCMMMDYAIWMGHNAYNSLTGEEDEISKKFTQSICTIICNMTGKPEAEVAQMLDNETFMDASEMINAGMCKRENLIVTTKKPKITANDAKGIYAICNQFLKEGQDKPKIKNMSKINNRLKLSNEASEDAQVEALDKVLSENEALKQDLKKAQDHLSEVQDELASKVNELSVFAEKEKQAKEQLAAELVENAVKEGKIEDAQKASWLKLANSSFEDTKAAINGIVKKTPHVSLMPNQVQKNQAEGRDTWTIRDWQTKDVEGLTKMYHTNRAEYDRLYNDFYILKKHK